MSKSVISSHASGQRKRAKGPSAGISADPPAGAGKSPRGRVPARTVASSPIDSDVRRQMIAEAAYYRAERRGFDGDGDLDDWLAAESEIDRLLSH